MKKEFVIITILLCTLLQCIPTEQSVGITGRHFELDGNLISTSRDDWDKVFLGTGGDALHVFNQDIPGANVFTSASDTDRISAWRWKSPDSSDNLPADLDLLTGFTAVYNNVGLFTDVLSLYFGAILKGSGRTTLGFWYLQSHLSTTSNGFNGDHQDGDLLIIVNLGQKGDVTNIRIYLWNSIGGPLVQVYSKDGINAVCRDGVDQTACAISNAVDVESYTGGSSLPKGTFVEGGIKLNDIFPKKLPCFSSYLMETKESIALDSQSRDFLFGDFQFCGILASLNCTGVEINAAKNGFAYSGVITVRNPYALIVSNVEVKLGGRLITTIPHLLPGETRNVDFDSTSSSQHGSVGPASVAGMVQSKYPVEYYTGIAKCPQFMAHPSLVLTKECEVRLAPYKFANDGTKEVKIFITGTVTNNGNIDLENVIVEDSDGFTWSFPYIKAGESIYFSRSIKSPDATIPQYTDTVNATGYAILKLGVAHAAPVTATCPAVPINPHILLSKTCVVHVVNEGDMQKLQVQYNIDATNDGNIDLRNIVIVDDGGTPNDHSDDNFFQIPELKVNETRRFNGNYYPLDTSAGSYTDAVYARAETIVHLFPNYTSDTVRATCKGILFHPNLELTKECSAQLAPHGDSQAVQVSFHGTVKNTGDITLMNVTVIEKHGSGNMMTFGPYTLAPGESQAFTSHYYPLDPTALSYSDTVSASGMPNVKGYKLVSAKPVTASCKGVKVNKKLELTKTCTVAEQTDEAGYISFVINVKGTVRNSGDIALVNVIVHDSIGGFSWNIGTLQPGQTQTFERQYSPQDPSQMSFSDTVTANGMAIAGFGSVSAQPVTATCSRKKISPSVKVDKSCSISLVSTGSGSDTAVTLEYSIIVTNNGNVALKDIMVTDDKGTPSDTSDDIHLPAFNLLPGQTKQFTGNYQPMNPLAASFQDTVRVVAKSIYKDFGNVVDTDTATCKNVPVNAMLSLTKQCSTSLEDTENGGKAVLVSYVITAMNNGNVPLKNVMIMDNAGSDDSKSFGPFNLVPGESHVVHSSYRPSNPAAESYSDSATAFADSTVAGYPRIYAQPANATCQGIQAHPKLALNKTCSAVLEEDTDGYQRVAVIVYGTATNKGDIVLNNITVRDSEQALVWNLGSLMPGESKSFTQKYYPSSPTASNYIDHIVGTADLPAGLGSTLSNTAEANCVGILPSYGLKLTKQCSVVAIDSSDYPGRKELRIRITGSVTNSGNDPLRNVTVIDDRGTPLIASDDILFGPYNLAGGETRSFETSYPPRIPTATSYHDTLSASGSSNIRGFEGISAEKVSATCQGIVTRPALMLTKQCNVSLEAYQGLQKEIIVRYQGQVTNSGNVTLVNVTVIDDRGTLSRLDDKMYGPFVLAPGESKSFSGVYVPALPTAPSYSDTVRASGDNLYVGFPGANAQKTATCENVQLHPKLSVTKKCRVSTIASGDMMKVLVSITGTVSNKGDVALYNVIVYDSDGTTWNYTVIQPGETKQFQRSYYPSDATAPEYSDTVYAMGNLPAGLGSVKSSNYTARCEGLLFHPQLMLTKQCMVDLVPAAGGLKRVRVTYSGTVNNTGDVALRNVFVVDDMGTPDQSDDKKFGPYTLAPGESASWGSSFFPVDPTAAYYHDSVTAYGDSVIKGFPGATATQVSAKCQGIQSHPELTLKKECVVSLVKYGNGKRVQVQYFGSVTNSGDTELINVMAIDDGGTPNDPSDDVTYGPWDLLPGKSQDFQGSYYPASPTQDYYSDTIRATGDNVIMGFSNITAAPVTARCQGIQVHPRLVLAKQCESFTSTADDGMLDVQVRVKATASNKGDVELLNVVITDSDGFKWNILVLAPGETKLLTRVYSPQDPTAEYQSDTITGSASLPAGLRNISAEAPATARCKGIVNHPQLSLEKSCYTVTEEESPGSVTKRVRVNYNGRVTNSGDVTLINVIVRDDKGTPNDSSDDETYGPFKLNPGQSATFSGWYYPADATSANHSDTVTASGTNLVRHFAAALVQPVTATCEGIKTAPRLILTKQCKTSLEAQADGSKRVVVSFSGTVKNAGDVTLYDVYVFDNQGTPNDPNDDKTWGPYTLAPGAQESFNGKYYPANPRRSNYSDTVRATGKNSVMGFGNVEALPVTAYCKGIQMRPKLILTKQCSVSSIPKPGSKLMQVAIDITGTATNQGNVELLNIMIMDSDGFTWMIDRLGVGESQNFYRRVIPDNPMQDYYSDTITANASLPANLGSVSANSVSAQCKGIKNNPNLVLTKECTVDTEMYSDGVHRRVRVMYQGTVKNSGNVDLYNIRVIDDSGTPLIASDDKLYGPFDLKVGESASWSGWYYPQNPMQDYYQDTARAYGDNSYFGFPGVTARNVTATCKGIKTHPALQLQKICMVDSRPHGAYRRVHVSYKGTVTNTGDTTLINVMVWDSADGQLMSFGPFTIAPGASVNFSGDYYPSNPTSMSFSDTASARGDNIVLGLPGAVADNYTATCKNLVTHPALSLHKECEAVFVGTGYDRRVRVNFRVNITNTGDITLVDVSVVDDSGTPNNASDDQTFGPVTLAPGQWQIFEGYYWAPTANAESFSDTVRAYGNHLFEGYPQVSASPYTAQCNGMIVSPTVALSKNCTASLVQDPNNVDRYQVQVHIMGSIANIGNIEVENVRVIDSDGYIWDIGFLGIGEIRMFERKYIPSNVTAEMYNDTIIARGNALLGFGQIDFAPASASCPGVKLHPSLKVIKQCSTQLEKIGSYQRVVVKYHGTVTNNGDITLINVRAIDDMGTPNILSDDKTYGPWNLRPGESASFQASYYPLNPMAAVHSDHVRVSGDNIVEGFPGASDETSAICTGIFTRPLLTLTKECVTRLVQAGNRRKVEVDFSGMVKNNGNITLVNVMVTDDAGTPNNPSDDHHYGPFILSPGQSRSFYGSISPSNATADYFSDTVTAVAEHGIKGFPNISAQSATATCKGIKLNPSLMLAKKCRTAFVGSGRSKSVQVFYEITVTNNGNVRLINVSVVDNKGTATPADDVTYDNFDLLPSQSRTFSGSYTPADATASNHSDIVTAFATNEVIGFPGAIAAPVTAVCAGVRARPKLDVTYNCDTIRQAEDDHEVIVIHTYGTVKNTGDIELVNIIVTANDGYQWTFAYLGIGESRSFSRMITPSNPMFDVLPQNVTAVGTAILGFGNTAQANAVAYCKGIMTHPQLVLEKECEVDLVDYPGKPSKVRVSYKGSVKNTGDVTLLNVVVIERHDSTEIQYGPFRLAPGAKADFSGSYFPSSPTDSYFQDTVNATAENIIRGYPGSTASPITAKCSGIVVHPILELHKECRVAVESSSSGNLKRVVVHYSGYVKNSGDVTLMNVVVIDDRGTPLNPSDDRKYGPFTLLPGEERDFNGTYEPTDAMADYHTDTVTATADNSIEGYPGAQLVRVNATCKGIKTQPALQLEKQCASVLIYTESGDRAVQVNYHGWVRNTGDVRLINVLVVDDRGTPNYAADDLTYGPFDLSPGESAPFNGSYIASNPTSHMFNDTVRASGQSEIQGFPGAKALPVTASCNGVIVSPLLVVNEQCVTKLEDYNGRKRIALYLSGNVTNAGDIELENVVAYLSDGSTVMVGDLGIGETYTFHRVIYPSNPTADNFPFWLYASGDAVLGLGHTNSSVAYAQCAGYPVNPKLQLYKECTVGLEAKGPYQKVVVNYHIKVMNAGDIDLINVIVKDDRGTPNYSADDISYGPFDLKVGESKEFDNKYYPQEPTAITQSDTVTASADNIIIGYPGTTARPVTATCKGMKVRPSLALEKECEVVLAPSSNNKKKVVVSYTIKVTNDGDVALYNVTVYEDHKHTPNDTSDDRIYGPIMLKPGESQTFTGQYYPSDPTAPYFRDTVRASGSNVIEGFGGVVVAPVEAQCKGLLFSPRLILTKQCQITVEELDIKDRGCISALRVDYAGTVSNAGDIGLVNVMIRDDQGTPNPGDDEFFGPLNLAPGEIKHFTGHFYPCVSGIPRTIQLSDTVTAKADHEVEGFAGIEAQPVTATCPVCY